MNAPHVSILVLTWNSGAAALEAVDSALGQTHGPVEVIVLDNASVDGIPLAVSDRFGDRVRVVLFEDNLGYAGGYNRGVRLARGDLLLLLNPDAQLAPDFLERALPAFEDPRVGIVAGRLMRPDGTTVDSSGQFLARSRKPLDRGFGRPFDPHRDVAGPVLGACGAAALYRRAMIEDIADDGELFDPDYFAFGEDLEVAWRAWRAGWRALAVPDAVCVHDRSGGRARGPLGLMHTRSDRVVAHILKNRYLALLRHDRPLALLRDLPWVAGRDAALLGSVAVRRPRVLRELWRHRRAFVRAWHKRRGDTRRSGAWGRWRRAVPRRGAWPAGAVVDGS
jgi:GT2 family glycosyltransferase